MRRTLKGWDGGISVGDWINNLRFADNTTLIMATKEEMSRLLQRVVQKSVLITDYNCQQTKTKVMFIDGSSTSTRTYELKDIETVIKFIYLGSNMNNEGGCEIEIKRTILLVKIAMTKFDKNLAK